MALVRCRHCHALVVPDDPRCTVCHGADPSGRRHALLGSLFLGGLGGAAVTGLYAAGLWWKWHRWIPLFGDPDDLVAADNARNVAVIAGAFVFLTATLVAAALIHRTARFR